MSSTEIPSIAGPWVVAGSAPARAALAPLLEARRALQPVVELAGGVEAFLAAPARHLPAGTAAVLIVGPRRRSPARMLPGLFLPDSEGRRVPVGWLPDLGDGLAVYARAAARVVARPRAIGPVVILGQWEDRFLRVGLRTARWFEKHDTAGVLAFHWTADRILRMDMLAGLADTAPGLALYYGHGRPRGWAGYHGVRLEHFEDPWPEPIGALLALCCENASRLRTGMSFAEALALRGVFAGGLAAVRPTLHEHNRRLGPDLCEALTAQPVATLAELVLALPPADWARTPYRFIGDPAAPLAGASGAAERAACVFAPAPDDPLPPWEELPA
ncbi:MAG TPA: hypothetical protein VGD81_18535 [Opitutaceae bacterium]